MRQAMGRVLSVVLAAALALGPAVSAQRNDKQKKPLTNDDVVSMIGGGLSEPVVISAIEASNTDFDISAQGLLGLKKAKISDKIIEAMTNAESRKHNPQPVPVQAQAGTDPSYAAAQAQAMAAQAQAQAMMQGAPHNGFLSSFGRPGSRPGGAPPMAPISTAGGIPGTQVPKVLLLLDGQQLPMQSSTAQVAKSETKGGGGGSSLGSTALNMAPMAAQMGLQSFAMTSMNFAMMTNPATMMAMPAITMATHLLAAHHSNSGPTTTYVWALPGRVSPFAMQALNPKFDIQFGDIVGVDPDQYEPVLVKLVQTKDNWRLVGASKDKIDMAGNDTRSSITQEPVDIVTNQLGRGHDVVELKGPLAPGEYGLVLHPKKQEKKSAADQQAMNNEGNLFLTVWDFTVPDTGAKPDATKPDGTKAADTKIASKQ